MFIVAGVASLAFLGGWLSPIPGYFEGDLWGIFWFVSKATFLIFVMIQPILISWKDVLV